METSWLPQIDWTLCTGCGECVTQCPTQTLGMVSGKAAVTNPAACTYSAVCEAICPVDAIALPYRIRLIRRGDSPPAADPSSLSEVEETK